MAYQLSSNLKLRLNSNLTADARYNLEKLDTLGSTFLVDSTSTLRLRSITDILLEPESADLGGSGVGGTLSIGTSSHSLASILLYGSTISLSSPVGLLDQGTLGTKYLRLKYNSTLSGAVDTVADRVLSIDLQGADRSLILGGNLTTAGGALTLTVTGTADVTLPTTGTLATLAGTETLTGKTIDAGSNTITGLTNSSVAASAGIVYSKLALTASLVDADISASAAVAYSKLALTGSIVGADISASAAIGRSKLATGTASSVLINDGSGVMSSEATLAKSRGGTGADNSSVTFPSSGVLVTRTATETLSGKTLSGSDNTFSSIPYSALVLSSSVVNADVSSSAAIAGTKISPSFGAQTISTTGSLTLGGTTIAPSTATLSYALPEVAPTTDQVLSSDAAGTLSWRTLPGVGTVTSVALALPTALFDVSGSPVTGSGTLTATLDTQSAGTVFAGPGSGAAATPGFRALSTDDLPSSIPVAKLAALTASRALVSDGSGVVSPSAVTSTELGYLSGVTSSIQTQLDSTAPAQAFTWAALDGTTKAVTHTLATADVTVTVYDIDTGAETMVDSIVRTSTSVVTLTSSTAPTGSGFRILVRK